MSSMEIKIVPGSRPFSYQVVVEAIILFLPLPFSITKTNQTQDALTPPGLGDDGAIDNVLLMIAHESASRPVIPSPPAPPPSWPLA